jgi:hypothetical protein
VRPKFTARLGVVSTRALAKACKSLKTSGAGGNFAATVLGFSFDLIGETSGLLKVLHGFGFWQRPARFPS